MFWQNPAHCFTATLLLSFSFFKKGKNPESDQVTTQMPAVFTFNLMTVKAFEILDYIVKTIFYCKVVIIIEITFLPSSS